MAVMLQQCRGDNALSLLPAVGDHGVARAPRRPAVLVSVRDVHEAAAALAGGCDLLDVKAPERGSLGRADAEVVCEILRLRDRLAPQIPVSMALGELSELLPASHSGDAGRSVTWRVPDGVAFVKLGLAGMRDVADWPFRWREAMRTLLDCRYTRPPQWVAVAYADGDLADAPALRDVVSAAVAERCAGVLVDTWSKSSGGLLSCLSLDVLRKHLKVVSEAGLLTALAGRLSLEDAVKLAELPVDVIAIRSAACRLGNRMESVCQARVSEFCGALESVASQRRL